MLPNRRSLSRTFYFFRTKREEVKRNVGKKFLKHIFNIIMCLCLSTMSGFAVLIADIGWEKEAPSKKKSSTVEKDLKKRVRVVFFNTDTQKFENEVGRFPGAIYYFPLPDEKESQDRTLPILDWFTLKYEAKTRKISLDTSLFRADFHGSKIIRSAFPASSNSVLTRFSDIEKSEEKISRYIFGACNPKDPYPNLSYSLDMPKMIKFFDNIKNREKTRSKELSWISNYYNTLNKIEEKIEKFNSNDSGSIGELASDMTMQWLGFHKKEAKYGNTKENGFDGVYSNTKILVLSEAKMWKRTISIPEVLNLLYTKINPRIKELENCQLPVGKYIREFIENHLENVYLQPYIGICDGQVKSTLRPLLEVQKEATLSKSETNLIMTPTQDNFTLKVTPLTPFSPEEDKVTGLANFLRNMGISSLEEGNNIINKAFQKLQEKDQIQENPPTPISKHSPNENYIVSKFINKKESPPLFSKEDDLIENNNVPIEFLQSVNDNIKEAEEKVLTENTVNEIKEKEIQITLQPLNLDLNFQKEALKKDQN